MYAEYHEQIQFLVVYIREAHPMDGWNSGKDHGIYDPKTIEERRELAVRCEVAMEYGIQSYVDEMDDGVMTAYYRGGRGPGGFSPPELKEAMDSLQKKESVEA